jgi:hypothetical protein
MNNLFDSNSFLSKILASFMVFVYAGLGAIFLFVPVLWENFTGSSRMILGIALILYSIFRLYRIIRTKNVNDNED